jgi:hypothetical protein
MPSKKHIAKMQQRARGPKRLYDNKKAAAARKSQKQSRKRNRYA